MALRRWRISPVSCVEEALVSAPWDSLAIERLLRVRMPSDQRCRRRLT